MNRMYIVTLGLVMGLVGVRDEAAAQELGAPVVLTNADGNCAVSPAPPNAGGWTITCGDIGPGSGTTVIGPPVITSAPPAEVVPAPAPAAAPVTEGTVEPTSAPLATETAVATATDLDADNYADAQEGALGLDPANADTDADRVADGDELNLYSTDPTIADTDGDGVIDGAELFDTHTDPLLWNDAGAASTMGSGDAALAPASAIADGVSGTSLLGPDGVYSVSDAPPPVVTVANTPSTPALAPAAAETTTLAEPVVADSAVATGTDLDADNAPDSAELTLGLDPNNPDSDGDLVADGDETAIYGTDPLASDTDGDGFSDGDELFSSTTDPLVWDVPTDGLEGLATPT